MSLAAALRAQNPAAHLPPSGNPIDAISARCELLPVEKQVAEHLAELREINRQTELHNNSIAKHRAGKRSLSGDVESAAASMRDTNEKIRLSEATIEVLQNRRGEVIDELRALADDLTDEHKAHLSDLKAAKATARQAFAESEELQEALRVVSAALRMGLFKADHFNQKVIALGRDFSEFTPSFPDGYADVDAAQHERQKLCQHVDSLAGIQRDPNDVRFYRESI